jgi:hypothetical protein
VLEAAFGARAGARRRREQQGGELRAMTARECLRVSVVYSAGFVVVTLPLATWTRIAARSAATDGGAGASWTLFDVAIFLGAVVVATFARAALMRLLSPQPRRS